MGFWFEYDAELARRERDAEAREEGLAEGIEEGLLKGRLEEKVALIKNLLVAKTPLNYIVTATGWSEEKILELAKS